MRSDIALTIAVVGAVILGGSIAAFMDWRKADSPEVIYCTDVATESTPRCPPEPNVTVLALWSDGSTATVQWSGKVWQIRVPGGRYTPVGAPDDWTEL